MFNNNLVRILVEMYSVITTLVVSFKDNIPFCFYLGYATRHCVCLGENCAWAEPNFAKCQSVYLVYEVYDKVGLYKLSLFLFISHISFTDY